MLTSNLQFAFAILCACLPTYAPLLRLFRWRGKSTRQVSPNWKSSFGTPQGHNGQRDNSQNSGYTHKRLIGSSFDRSHEQSHNSDWNGKSYRNDSFSTRNTAENDFTLLLKENIAIE
ncbi:hypothetical protein N7456_013161 [Penicillium angulare]|uniref:Uncharacterized protein n=1 Tax=Penicillium angulare TaxID=116970 RepID=A0A9W9EL36_9EURO|nr:hypothetical protein N7456_013161 [Penicillium angulare]